MPKGSSQLANIFQQVASTLVENQQALNQADTVNQDHGDNMVQTFETIAAALQQKQGSSDSAALSYAAKQLSKNTKSGSGQLYAQGLTQAAAQLKGRSLDAQTGMQLLQTLIGGGQASTPASLPGADDLLGTLMGGLAGAAAGGGQAPQAGGGDLLGSLLGGLAGGGAQAAPVQPQQAAQGGDLLGSLLGGLAGGNTGSQTANNGLDMGDLLNAGMAFMQAKQSGGSTTQALMQAFLAGSGMGSSAHRSQSTQLVVSSFLNALGAVVK